MEIRPVREDELAALHDELWVPFSEEMAALDDYDALADYDRETALAYRRENVASEDHHTVVAVAEGGDLAGYAHVERQASPPVFARGDVGYVHGVYVRPAFRRGGLADRLLDRVEGWARDRGCEYATLSVNVRNEAARELYEGRGYVDRYRKMTLELGDGAD